MQTVFAKQSSGLADAPTVEGQEVISINSRNGQIEDQRDDYGAARIPGV
jgi:hypothetical protein